MPLNATAAQSAVGRTSAAKATARIKIKPIKAAIDVRGSRMTLAPPAGRPHSRRHIINQKRNHTAQVAPVNDPVDEAVLLEKLAGLEAFGQLHADGLLDDLR